MADRPMRALLPHALTALAVITDFKARRIRVHDFELVMNQQGLFRPECRGALATFTRRGWVSLVGSTIVVTDDGWLAVTKGIGVKVKDRKRAGRSGNRRMPPDLFQV